MRTPTRTALVVWLLASLAGCYTKAEFDPNMPLDAGKTEGGDCMPEATAPCYDGPSGTEGQGICKAGTRRCGTDGTYGPCMGEVTPKLENCATSQDENCDGLALPCTGSLLWAKRFGLAGDQRAHGVAVDSDGNVIVTGDFSGTMDFGGDPLTSAGGSDIFVVKFDATGKHLWSKRFGDMSFQTGASIATDRTGNVLIAGAFSGALDFGEGALTSAGGLDVFVAKFDAKGNHAWSKRFGDVGPESATSVAVDASGNVIITGFSFGTVDFGGGPIFTASKGAVFLAKLSVNGDHLWSKQFGVADYQAGNGVAVEASGNIVVTGFLSGSADFGGGLLKSAGSLDIFIAKLDAKGNHLWSNRFGDAKYQEGLSVALDSAGNAFATGSFSGAVDFGGGPLTSPGSQSILLPKFDASGKPLWSKRFRGTDDQVGNSVAVDSSGNVVVAGYTLNEPDFGGPLASQGNLDVFLAKLDTAGNLLWSKRFGDDASAHVATSITTDGEGNVVTTGFFYGSIDFGVGPLVSAGGSDIFVAKFSP